jgi:hypothetical protein
MKSIRLLTLGAALAVALPAAAADKSAINPRQVAHCMLSRMKANQSESYREAFKVCKQQVDPASRDTAGTTAMNTAGSSEHPKQ